MMMMIVVLVSPAQQPIESTHARSSRTQCWIVVLIQEDCNECSSCCLESSWALIALLVCRDDGKTSTASGKRMPDLNRRQCRNSDAIAVYVDVCIDESSSAVGEIASIGRAH